MNKSRLESILTIILLFVIMWNPDDLNGQSFSEVQVNLAGFGDGDLEWGDYDNDGDLDLAFVGGTSSLFHIYRNDGDNLFTEISTSIPDTKYGSLAWGDYDGDDDLDLLITGDNSGHYARIYQNTSGTFSDISAGLPGFGSGSCEWGDYDNDGDLDILICGENLNNATYLGYQTLVYQNNSGVFTDIEAGLTGVGKGNATWGDYDGDNDLDIALVSGSLKDTTKIYRMDNDSTYTEISAGLAQLSYGSITWGDYDNDSDLDILLTGKDGSNVKTSKIYRYDGDSTFTDISAGLTGVLEGEAKWGDLDGDDDLDVLLTGQDASDNKISKIYRNSSGTFAEYSAGLTGVVVSSCDWGDYNADGYIDLAIAGEADGLNYITKIYYSHRFEEDATASIEDGTYLGSADWGDYDGDGDLDLAVIGYNSSESKYLSKVYRNDGGSTFTSVTAINDSLTGVGGAAVQWGDYDNDGDLDLAISGQNSSADEVSNIYRNDGATFTDIGASLTGLYLGSIDWGDYDNDGDLDLLMTGNDGTNKQSIIYQNSNGVFSDISAGLTGINYGSAQWGDYDSDGDLDIVLSGRTASSRTSRIYTNNGSGSYTADSTSLTALEQGYVNWGDYDGDGDLDIVLTGMDSENVRYAKIYKNSSGTFADISTGLTGLQYGRADWGDFDNDGDLDLLLVGQVGSSSYFASVYRNNGSDSFTDVDTVGITALTPQSAAEWGDYDNDGDLDFLYTGTLASTYYTKIYENKYNLSNTTPNAPTGLSASVSGNSVTLSWTKATDTETAQDGLTYNIRVGTTAGGSDIISGMVNTSTGYRRVARAGNVGHTNSWVLKNISTTPDKYYWSVQSIDNNYKGSAFATEGIFEVDGFSANASALTGVYQSDASWGDMDNDGDLDLLVTGHPGASPFQTSKLYTNSGGSFTENTSAGIGKINSGSSAWGDYNNDGFLDIVVVGYNGTTYSAILYKNDGDGTFSDASVGLTGLYKSSSNWVDYDNDGDLDLFITGTPATAVNSTLYRNDGSDTFTAVVTGIDSVKNGSSSWGDYDCDGDMDLHISGDDGSDPISQIYRNDAGTFTDISAGLTGLESSASDWGDYDSDGDLDLIVTGTNSSTSDQTILYRNDGSDTFTSVTVAVTKTRNGSIEWGDYDNDGDLDILIAGYGVTSVWANTSGVFSNISAGLSTISGDASVAWGDYDADGDLDLVIVGNSSGYIAKIYENHRTTSNTAPAAPTGLSASSNGAGTSMTFSWTATTDTETSANGLSYNLKVGTTSGGNEVMAAMASSAGVRRLPDMGNVGQNTSWTVSDLSASTTYYWSVQTIDNGLKGSSFATEETDTSLPVELSYFKCVQDKNSVLLTWATESETENLGFIIERRQDDEDWTEIASFTTHAELRGQGSTSQRTEYSFTDKNIQETQIYEYRLADVSYEGVKVYHSVPAVEIEITEFVPDEFTLNQNYPNPFNPSTTIRYGLPEEAKVSLVIYDVRGQVIQTIISDHQLAGWYDVTWNGETSDGKQISTGIYFARLVAGKDNEVIKMLYLK